VSYFTRNKQLALPAAIVFIVFVGLDFVWLNLASDAVYGQHLSSILAKEPDARAAAMFYVLYAAGLTLFVVRPNLETGTVRRALMMGAGFGLVAYGTYDLTNQATLATWSAAVTIIDMLWGAVLSGIASAAGLWAGQKIKL
jgi:uncharacterized membrane protein